ncbi:MAG: OmpA family protein [Peptococcaceae bacterium]|jgi:chemotaxis protein MotB|nr:OmpA family protein [Peptococcaceae bacterium]MDH7525003.1 OmpA family protein [Peptococcaceae bacterium]
MLRKKKHADHINMERWLISYADFITLLFILFIILYSFSQIDIQKYKQMAASLAGEFGGSNPIMEHQGQGHSEEKSPAEIENETLARLAEEIRAYGQQRGITPNLAFRVDERGLHISITGTVLFNDASAALTPQAKEFISIIFEQLKNLPNPILIEGHTDNRPINTREFPSNWELSAARSINLVRYLIEEYKFDPRRLSSAAYGEYRPVAPNDTPENQAKNRRVEIIILRTNQSAATPVKQ